MKKVVFLYGGLLFFWMSMFHGSEAQSRNIFLCQYSGAAQNGTSFPAELGGSVNVTICVSSPYNYPLHNYAKLESPGGSSRSAWLREATKLTVGESQSLITYTISDLRQHDFDDKFVIQVFYKMSVPLVYKDALVFTFSLYKARQKATTDASDDSDKEDYYDDDDDDKSSQVTCTGTETNDGICDSEWKYVQGKCIKLFDKETFRRAVEICGENGGQIVGDLESLKQCFGGVVPDYVKVIWTGELELIDRKCTVLKRNNEIRKIGCANSKRFFLCGKAPATISAFQLSQGDPLKNFNEITYTDLIKTNLLGIKIEEKDNYLTFTCNATGSPRPQVSINHNNKGMNQSSDGYVIYVLEKATCKDSGSYSCRANNSFGETVLISPPVEVLCPVEIISFTIYDAKTRPGSFLQTYQSHPVSFSCEAEGNPAPNIVYIQNERNVTLSSTFFQNSVSYNINDVRCPHMGGYYCKVDTPRNEYLQERVELAVSSCPVQLCNPSDSSTTISSPLGGTVSIPLCLISYDGYTQSPRLVVVVVEKDNGPIYNRGKYSLEATKLPDSKIYWNATLEIHNIEQRDFGTMVFDIDNYNRKSPLTYTVHLNAEGPPSCPSNINVTNQGTSYITLSWHPGFDGGADQSFRVYHSVDNVTWTQTDVRGSANSYTLKGLTENTLYAIRVAATNKFTDPRNINEELCNSTVYQRTDVTTVTSTLHTTTISSAAVMTSTTATPTTDSGNKDENSFMPSAAAVTTTTTPATDKENKSVNSDQELTTLSIVFVILGVLATLVVATTALGLYFYCRFKRLRSHPWTSRTCPPQRDGSNIPATKQMSLTESGDRSNRVYQNTSGSSMTSSQHKDGQHVSETTHQMSLTDSGNRSSVRYQNTNEEPVYEQPVEPVYEQPVEPVYEKISELVYETVM